VLLVVEQDKTDPAGGHDAGVAMARRALDDAASVGYPDGLPIFFCAGNWLSLAGIPDATAMSYLDGAASVVGKSRVGAYGFRDFIQAAKAGGHAEWLWLCGAAPEDGEVTQGWPHLVAMVIASLTGSRAISPDVVTATTLILGGLIGILAPTPTSKKRRG
jgi:Rv2525c-like, glycoside hydrolase-like domain